MELGLRLGLKKTTLDVIEANYPRDVGRCLIECLSKWLERADDVDSKGGAVALRYGYVKRERERERIASC